MILDQAVYALIGVVGTVIFVLGLGGLAYWLGVNAEREAIRIRKERAGVKK